MIAPLTAQADLAAAQALLERSGLRFEAGCDELLGVHDGGELLAVGARAGNILKMLAVDPAHRGGALLGELVSALVARGLDAGCESLFIYTKPPLAKTFAALNFTLLAEQGTVALLEFGKGLKHWLASQQPLLRAGTNGLLAMPGDPFTPRQRLLAEAAARAVDHLYLVVPGDDGARLPVAEHCRRLRQETRGIANAIVLDTGPYQIAAATFPTYFLKPDAPLARIRAELDATLFASRIAPFFGISRRFTDAAARRATAGDEAATKAVFEAHGIEVSEIPCADGESHPDALNNPIPGGSR